MYGKDLEYSNVNISLTLAVVCLHAIFRQMVDYNDSISFNASIDLRYHAYI